MTDMSEMTELSAKEAVALGASSLDSYGKIFFPRTFRQESPPFHKKIGTELYSTHRYTAVEVFRGGAKTSLLRVYTSQRVAYALSRLIGYVSVSQLHSKFSLRWLRRQVEHNKKWASTFGLEKGDKWTDEWMEIKCNLMQDENGGPVIITILALGITGQIRGFNPDDFRFDLLIIDDCLDDENSATPDQRKKIEDLLFGALLKSLAPQSEAPLAKAVFLQTPMHKEDAIEKCMKDPEWHPVRVGLIDYSTGTPQSNWPSRYPIETVLKEKEAHIRRSQFRLWMREMECQLVSGEEKAIDVSKIKYWDVLPERMDKVISSDPASSDSPKADKFVNVSLGFKGPDVYLIAGAAAEKNDPGKAANDVMNLVLLTRPRKIVVESVAFQRVFKWILEQEMTKRKLYVPVEELKVRTSNADRIMQVLPGLIAFGHFHIHPSMLAFVSEADDYDPQTRDPADDWLTAVANGIIAQNPALRSNLGDSSEDGDDYIEDEEREYKRLSVRACP